MTRGRMGVVGAKPSLPPPTVGWHAAFWADDPAWSNPGDGVGVGSWRDYSGNSRTATQAVVGQKPIYRASVAALNNRAAVQGDGDNDILVSVAIGLTQPFTMVLIGSMVVTPTTGPFPAGMTLGNNISGTDLIAMYRTTSGNFALFAGADAATIAGDDNVHGFRGLFNGASSALRVDGSGATGDPGSRAPSSDPINLFGSALSTDTTNNAGYIAFAGIYSGDVTADGGWTAFKAWALSYYGVTLS